MGKLAKHPGTFGRLLPIGGSSSSITLQNARKVPLPSSVLETMDATEMRQAAEETLMPANSFDELFEEHYEPVLRALYLLTGNSHEAEDLAQEAFARIYERGIRLSPTQNVAGYVYRIAVNLHRSRLRRLGVAVRRLRMLHPREVGDDFGPIDDRDVLGKALARLSRAEREALVLVEWVGMTDAEAGEVLGTTPGAISTRISRAKARLRLALREGVDDDDSAS
jgi:RNA polymerase sigma factor (sigma-70 family)